MALDYWFWLHIKCFLIVFYVQSGNMTGYIYLDTILQHKVLLFRREIGQYLPSMDDNSNVHWQPSGTNALKTAHHPFEMTEFQIRFKRI